MTTTLGMKRLGVCLAAFLSLAAVAIPPRQEFPAAKPEDVGLSTKSLRDLDAVIDGFIEKGDAVGAELIVIKDRKSIWHTGHGFADREAKAKLQPGSIFCIRSMTKPFVGTAIQMLIDDGKLSPTDTAAKFLPAFDTDSHRDITIRELLTHSSGLQLSSLLAHDLKTMHSVQDVAQLAAESELESKPGEKFNYSDDGTDTLTAIVEKASGMSAAEFIQTRILTPLGMNDPIPVAAKDDPRRSRMIPLYVGSTGSWNKYWTPDQDAMFPYFLGSQAMYSTCEDYARLLCLWADGGTIGGKSGPRILSVNAVKRGLTPGFRFEYPTEFAGVSVQYACLWMLWMDESETPPKRLAFGHGGSDGTQAWMWPEQDLIILYCTQSRGGTTTISIEKDIQRLILDPLGVRGKSRPSDSPADPKSAPSVVLQGTAPLIGLYDDKKEDSYVAIFQRDGKLNIDFPGRFCGTIVPASEPNQWKIELDPTSLITFEAGTDATSPAAALKISGGGQSKKFPRREKPADLPPLDEVIRKFTEAHGSSNFSNVGAIKRTFATSIPKLNRTIKQVSVFDKARMHIDVSPNVGPGQVITSEGKHAWARAAGAETQELSGVLLEQTLLEHIARVFSDWRESYAEVTLVGRATTDGKPVLLVRCVPRTAFPCTMILSDETGMLLGQERTSLIPGLGSVGVSVRFDDYRDVGGIKLPYHSTVGYAHPMLGDGETKTESYEIIALPDASFFEAPAADKK